MSSDPFRALGLSPGRDLTDDDVRAAWHRRAEATHPDRADGGDPAAFAAAASAYSDLRTTFGRNEALADLTVPASRASTVPAWAARVRHGRPLRLALRVLAAAAASALVVVINGWQPATPALIAGALTWLLRSARHDLCPGPPRPGRPAGGRGYPGPGPVASGLDGSATQPDQEPT